MDGKFNLRRMLRLTSNDMDSDPRFFKQLLLYNEVHHRDYNPQLDSKTYKFIMERLMNIKVSSNAGDFDKRFMVRAPN